MRELKLSERLRLKLEFKERPSCDDIEMAKALEDEVKEIKAEIRKDVLHWHELFGEHLTPESKKDENFMLGYYSGRKDQALKYAKDLGIKEELNQAQEGESDENL
ncbi:hypothetical protein LCGC14_1976600 [marine sediment metagenome]|uniref:Uncharacterized protein n=1 Tax=marine sediment metagenome TaxID=412755 RepID=A0A0F9BCY0_9ZZZZ